MDGRCDGTTSSWSRSRTRVRSVSTVLPPQLPLTHCDGRDWRRSPAERVPLLWGRPICTPMSTALAVDRPRASRQGRSFPDQVQDGPAPLRNLPSLCSLCTARTRALLDGAAGIRCTTYPLIGSENNQQPNISLLELHWWVFLYALYGVRETQRSQRPSPLAFPTLSRKPLVSHVAPRRRHARI
jgi:hypothetical protein